MVAVAELGPGRGPDLTDVEIQEGGEAAGGKYGWTLEELDRLPLKDQERPEPSISAEVIAFCRLFRLLASPN